MRKLGIGRPNKRLRPTETPRQAALSPPDVLDEDGIVGGEEGGTGTASQGLNVLHSTAIGSPSKRIALTDPLGSDDEILSASPISVQRSRPVPVRVIRTQIPPRKSQTFSPELANGNVDKQNEPDAVATNGNANMDLQNEPDADTANGNANTEDALTGMNWDAGAQNVPAAPEHNLHPLRKVNNVPVVVNASTGYPDFSNVLHEFAFVLSTPAGRNYMQKSELLFRKELNEWIDGHLKKEPQEFMNPGMKFVAAMQTYLSTQVNLRHSMTPTQHPDLVPQRSLLHNLLCVPTLQPQLLAIVFPALAEACYSAGDEQDTVDTLVSIVHQLRWIPKIVDAEKFVTIILDFVKSGTAVAQKQLISNLPEIIPEDKHQKIADTLKSLLEKPQDAEVVPAIMDCYSSLDVPSKEWMKVHEAALSQMFNSSLAAYPAFFAFLFRTEDPVILMETISKMRKNLQITPLTQDMKTPVHMCEIVDKIRFCTAVNSQLIPMWVKQVKQDIEDEDQLEELQPIDLIMLLIFAEYAKPPVTTLNLLFSKKDISIKLFDNLLEHNLPILNQVFKTLLSICCLAIRGKETHPVMEHILTNLFLRLSLIESQEIAFRLSSFLMESTAGRLASLRILTQLATKNPARLLHFSAHLMSVVASVMRYPSGQIKQLMNVLAMLANIEGNRSSEAFASELAIFLRKQLTHFTDSTRCFGVLGTIATVKQMCPNKKDTKPKTGTNSAKIKEFLDLVWSLVEREEDACVLFFDELAEIADVIPGSVLKKYQTVMATKFEEYWTTSNTAPKGKAKTNDDIGLRLSDSFDANAELLEKEQISVSFQEKPLGMSPLVAPSHLRLVGRLVSAQENGDLSLIDAILGCPVVLPDVETYYMDSKKLSECSYDQRKKLGLYLILSINFFRESISAFIAQIDPELRIKIWLRLANVAYLQQALVKNFHQFPCLPKAYVEEVNATHRPGFNFGSSSSKQKPFGEITPKKKPSKPGKKKKDDADTTIQPKKKKPNKEANPKNKAIELENLIQPKAILPYLRRFDLRVFSHLLRFPLNDGPDVDFTTVVQNISASPAQQLREVAKFSPDTLVMLLAEINQQTKDQNSSFDVLEKSIVSSICSHLENIESLYEADKIEAEDESRFEACFRLLLHTFGLVLERAQARPAKERKDLMQKLVTKIAARVGNSESETEDTFSEKLKKAAQYFANFSKCVRSPSTAVEHLLLLKYLDDLAEGEDVVPCIENAAKTYLTKDWTLASSQVDTILKTWLKKAADPLAVIQELTQSLIPLNGDYIEQDIPCKETYKSCSRLNFHVWYSALVSSLSSHVSKRAKTMKTPDDMYEFWNAAILILKDLFMVIQDCRTNNYLVPVLKYTRQFLEAINMHCVKKLPSLIKHRESGEAKRFIKNLQTITRKVQIVCAHSKVAKDTSLLKFVPLLRKALESLVFRVRESLAESGLSGTFVLGSLKHKNIDGDAMNSQPYNMDAASDDEDSGEEESEAEEVEDDEDGDSDLVTDAAQLPKSMPSTSRGVAELRLSEDEDVEMEEDAPAPAEDEGENASSDME